MLPHELPYINSKTGRTENKANNHKVQEVIAPLKLVINRYSWRYKPSLKFVSNKTNQILAKSEF